MKIPVPIVEAGKIETYSKGWAKVTFKTPFKTVPAVVAVAEPKEEWFRQPTTYISLPQIVLQKLTPIDKVEIPRVQRPDLRVKFGDALKQKFIDVAGDWSVLNWLRDRFADIFYWIGYAIGTLMNWFWDNAIQPQVDKIAESIKNEINETIDKVNSSLSNLVNNIQSGLSALRNKAQEAINTIPEKTVEAFWSVVGYQRNLLGIPVAVRNVTTTGFEVWSPGRTTIYYVAVGGYEEYEVPTMPIPFPPKLPWK